MHGNPIFRASEQPDVVILRKCASGERIRFIRRLTMQPTELVLEVVERRPDGRRLERRLVLEKRAEGAK